MTTRPASTDDLRFLNQFAKVEHSENRLPHWQQPGATFFVTFRLADSIPQDRLEQWNAAKQSWLKWNPLPWSAKQEQEYHERFTSQIEAWLDEGAGDCLLRSAVPRSVVATALTHFDGQRCWQHAWVVMPNQTHALFSLIENHPLEDLLQSWKGYTAHEINKRLNRQGPLWLQDYFDRMIRDSRHFWRCARYIRRNPEKARLNNHEFSLHEASFVKNVLDSEMGNLGRRGAFPGAGGDTHESGSDAGRLESRPSAT